MADREAAQFEQKSDGGHPAAQFGTSDDTGMSREWHYHPDLPLDPETPFDWPPSFVRAYRWLAGSWFTTSTAVLWVILALASYAILPSMERMATLSLDWVAEIWLRNLVLLCVLAGGLHLYLYRFGRQGKRLKFDRRSQAEGNRAFTFGNQVKDNMFWSIVSGVTFWTAYEVLFFWAAANGWAPLMSFADNPVWFVAMFLILPLWSSMHFYWVHRLLHWPPLYKRAHALHHRNINVGPWSGLSMHPIEHALFFTNIAAHFVLWSHPVHVIYHMLFQSLHPVCSHSGFESLLVRNKKQVALGDFFHQLHHRYFECNYGTIDMPWDRWFGSFHDGTEQAGERLKQKRRERQVAA